jgi:hypothetical protein
LLCGAAALAVVAYAAWTRPAGYPGPTVTPRVITALAPPTAASLSTEASAAGPATEPSAQTSAVPPAGAGAIRVGQYVQVSGTGDAGYLNLRAEAGLQSPVNYLALERQVFQVQAGPKEADGFTWWYLVDPATSTRYGWAVQNYLQER